MNATFTDSDEQEIWSTIRALNDAWTQGNPDDLAHVRENGRWWVVADQFSGYP